jgi:hypothetical protein
MADAFRMPVLALAPESAPGLAAAERHTIAVAGLAPSHVWRRRQKSLSGKPARQVAVAKSVSELAAEAKKRGVREIPVFAGWKKMLDAARPRSFEPLSKTTGALRLFSTARRGRSR